MIAEAAVHEGLQIRHKMEVTSQVAYGRSFWYAPTNLHCRHSSQLCLQMLNNRNVKLSELDE